MDRSTRLRLVQQARDALDGMRWDEADLALEMFGIGAMPETVDGYSLLHWINDQASDEELLAIGRHLGLPAAEEAGAVTIGNTSTPTEPEKLFLFGSHLSTQRSFVGEVERALALYEITLFVAHDSIPVDADWEPEIADALRQCDAGVAFIHKGLHDSYYCMQEIGWLLGRGIPIARLMFDEAPRGLLGSKQGVNARAMDAPAVAEAIVDYVASKPELRTQLATSLTRAIRRSPSFKASDRIWGRLKALDELTLSQATTLLEAAEMQDQVYRAGVGGWGGQYYRSVIADFLDQQPAAAPLGERITSIRKHKDSGSPISMVMGDAD